MLQALIPSIRQAVVPQPNRDQVGPSLGPIPVPVTYEIIIVDGGSQDGTREYLLEQDDIRVIWQGERLGAGAAFNAGFQAATGQYVANLNDDAICIGPVLYEACRHLDRGQRIGQIALPFSDPRHPPAVHKVTVGNPAREYLYANFGVTRRDLGDRLGWWGNLKHYGGDTELSLQVWKAGYSVLPLTGRKDCFIRHYRLDDGTRQENDGQGWKLGKRWSAWDGSTDEDVIMGVPV